MGETSPDVVKQVEDVMRQKLDTVVQQEYSAAGGIKSLAEILNHTDRSTERNVLDSLDRDRRGARRARSGACCSSSRTSSSSTTARSSRCCARPTRRIWCWRCAACPTRSRSASSPTCPSAAPQMLNEEMEIPAAAAQARRRRGAGPDRGSRAQARGGRHDRALARRRRRCRLMRASRWPRRPWPAMRSSSSTPSPPGSARGDRRRAVGRPRRGRPDPRRGSRRR